MTHDEMIAVITAHKEGKKVQCKRKGGGAWLAIVPLWNFTDCDYRIAPPDDSDFKIDEPVMMRDFGENTWARGYFAGVHPSGKPLVFRNGGTLFSSKGDYIPWDECRRPTPEELKCGS